MRIAVYVPQANRKANSRVESFIVETFFLLIRQYPNHTYIIITDQKQTDTNCFLPDSKVVIIKSWPLKKLWGAIRMRGILKKIRADLLLMFENDGPLATAVPKCIVISGIKKIRPANIKNAQSLIVTNSVVKEHLIKKNQVSPEKIFVLYPYPEIFFRPVKTQDRENIKKDYSDSLEFFLYNSILDRSEDFVSLLKSFSHFKKRQQSSFKLLLLTQSNSSFEKTLSNYKYRSDVKIIQAKNKSDEAKIIAAAYAVILPFNTNEDMFAALHAMQAGVPVIAETDSVVNEIANDAAVYAESEVTKDIGDKMIMVYTNENYRSELINKGKTIAATFTPERSTDILWQSIMKALG